MNADVAARVEQLLEALRRETAGLGPLDDSALVYSPVEAPEATQE